MTPEEALTILEHLRAAAEESAARGDRFARLRLVALDELIAEYERRLADVACD